MKDMLELSILFDYYGGLLTEKQRTCFDLYYNQDLSLSEVAEECGISRQGVHDTLTRTDAALRQMELRLGCAERERRLRETEEELLAIARKLDETDTAAAESIRAAVRMMEKE